MSNAEPITNEQIREAINLLFSAAIQRAHANAQVVDSMLCGIALELGAREDRGDDDDDD